MTVTKVEAEQLFELTEPYSKTDLKKAARSAIRKWHPDMAARNGIDPTLASENYGKISDAEKHLAGFFDGHTDGYKVSPSTVDAGGSARTQRPETSTNAGKTDTSSSQSAPKEDKGKTKETRYWDAQTQQWKTDPTGKRTGWYDGGQQSERQRPRRSETTNAGDDEPKRAPKRPPRRPSETGRDDTNENQASRRNTRNHANPRTRPRPSGANGNAGRQDQPSSGAREEQVVQDEERRPTMADYLRQIAGERGKVKTGLVIFAVILFLLSSESAFRGLSPDTQPIWFTALAFVTPLSFLLLALVEFGFGPISSGICSSLGLLSDGLENDNPLAKFFIVILRLVVLLLKGLYKVVSWVVNYAIGK